MIQLLEVKNVVKRFSGVIALNKMNLQLRGGKIHCLVGENGAGKSTLIKILAGHYQPDEGEIILDGRPLRISDPYESRRLGISIIHQELSMIPDLSIAENISLGRLPQFRMGWVNWKETYQKAYHSLSLLDSSMDPTVKVGSLSTGEQQIVEIARSLSVEARILILDEPTASLSEAETTRLFKIIRELKMRGLAILYVSHRLEEVFELADDITVIRDGFAVASAPKEEINPDQVIRFMVGRSIDLERKKRGNPGKKILVVNGLGRKGVLRNVNFHLHEGEILGFAGLVGSGRTEIARCLFGLDRMDEGEILLDGEQVKIRSPIDAIRKGIGFVPEDRKVQGLVLQSSVRTNMTLSVLNQVQRLGWIKKKEETRLVENYTTKLRIKTPSIDSIVNSLSGGNQQKVILSRWLAMNPKILILDEPTRGVDVGARAEIQAIIEDLVQQGLAIIMISSDLMELLSMSDRIVVVRDGSTVAELMGEDASKEEVLKFAIGS